MRAIRCSVDVNTRRICAEHAADLLAASTLFQASQHIACYIASPEEFDCHPLIEMIWKKQKNCYLPILLQENELGFSHYLPQDPLAPNRYKILEPSHPQIFPKEELDLVLLPLVGFDFKGNRLGMGAGYYDKTFAFHKDKPFLLGLGYEIQKIEEITADPWDIPLDGVLTESKLYLIP